jgi:hypothetical protein
MLLAHGPAISLVLNLPFCCFGFVFGARHRELPGSKFALGYLDDIMVGPLNSLIWQRAGLGVLNDIR